jgi:polyferredoxin
MIRVRTTQRNFLLFHFITLSFLLLLVIALALDGRITHAEPPIGTVLSHEKSPLVPAVVTHVCSLVVIKLTRAIPATATQAQASSGCGVILDENGYILAII